jgi:hypothetical protein
MTIELAVILLIALLLTILIELGVLLLMGEREGRILWASVVINVLTNVPLNSFLFFFTADDLTVIVGEIIVVVVEALWYYAFLKRWKKAIIYSVLCNAISFLSGLLLLLLLLTFLHSY